MTASVVRSTLWDTARIADDPAWDGGKVGLVDLACGHVVRVNPHRVTGELERPAETDCEECDRATDQRPRVWCVEAGAYSSAYTHGIYSTQAIADAVAARIPGAHVWDCVIDEDASLVPPTNFTSWRVWITSDGNVTSVETRDIGYRDGFAAKCETRFESYEAGPVGTYGTQPRTDVLRNPTPLQVVCWARDEDHAIKIAGELRAQWVAIELPKLVASGKVGVRK